MLKLQNLKFLQDLFESFMHNCKISDYNIKLQILLSKSDVSLVFQIYFFRWITKSEHGVSNTADEVKARIRHIANSPTNESASQAITDLQE